MPFLPCLLSFLLLHSFSFLCYFSFNSLCFLPQSLSCFHLWLLVLFVMILFSHLLHIFSLLKCPCIILPFNIFHLLYSDMHKPKSSYSHLFTFVSPLSQPLLHLFFMFFFHFFIPAKSLILAIID